MKETTMQANKINGITPGPWKVMKPYSNRSVYPIGYCIGNGAYRFLAEVNSQGGDANTAQANARLVAASPDLLAVAEWLAGVGDTWMHCGIPGLEQARCAARGAVARAHGRACEIAEGVVQYPSGEYRCNI